ncbi:MAG TPA: AraC family transcriptional regulator [Verrucomicrobiae bacterium]
MESEPQLNQLISRHLGGRIRQVVVCGRQLRPPPYSYVVAFPRLELPVAGCYENQIELNGQVETVRLRPGSALFSAANCWNQPTWQHDVTLVSILFGKRHLGISIVTGASRVVPELMAQKLSVPFPVSGPLPHVLNAMIELQAGHGAPASSFMNLANVLTQCVANHIQTPASQPVHPAQNLLDSVCVYLQNHYQYDITRDSVASQFAVSPNHLSRIFRTQGHMSFNDYLTHVRIDRGKYLLCHYNLKIEDVAGRCGYSNAAYFGRVFKRVTRTTPAEYRSIYNSRKLGAAAAAGRTLGEAPMQALT